MLNDMCLCLFLFLFLFLSDVCFVCFVCCFCKNLFGIRDANAVVFLKI